MSPMPTPEPQAMGIPELQDYLVATAEAARSAVAADDYGAVRNSRRQLCEWADRLTGPKLALVEVALAFLDNLMGDEISEGALAARGFLDAWTREATPFFDELVRGFKVQTAATRHWPAGARQHLDALEKAGVILHDSAQDYVLGPTSREWLREMIEPLPFRMWRIVSNARVRAASLTDNDARVVAMAALTGVTETQARAHISRIPRGGASRSVHISGPRYVRSKPLDTARRQPNAGKNSVTGVASPGSGPVRNDGDVASE
jgi:hypothetical protein